MNPTTFRSDSSTRPVCTDSRSRASTKAAKEAFDAASARTVGRSAALNCSSKSRFDSVSSRCAQLEDGAVPIDMQHSAMHASCASQSPRATAAGSRRKMLHAQRCSTAVTNWWYHFASSSHAR